MKITKFIKAFFRVKILIVAIPLLRRVDGSRLGLVIFSLP
jgi:hypothetical protein